MRAQLAVTGPPTVSVQQAAGGVKAKAPREVDGEVKVPKPGKKKKEKAPPASVHELLLKLADLRPDAWVLDSYHDLISAASGVSAA